MGSGEGARGLEDRLIAAINHYPCSLLFVHRDAEGQDPRVRYDEIQAANRTSYDHVCVVPVRMQEAWLLHDETAIREAAGRPSGRGSLHLPPLNRRESVADPKQVLHGALRAASEVRGQRAKRFKPGRGGSSLGGSDHRLVSVTNPHCFRLSSKWTLERPWCSLVSW